MFAAENYFSGFHFDGTHVLGRTKGQRDPPGRLRPLSNTHMLLVSTGQFR